jgi:hypothetical protein
MIDHHNWQLDGSAAELYQRYLVPAIMTKWAEDLVDRAQPAREKWFSTSLAEPGLLRARQAGGWPRGTSPAWT